MKVIKPQLVSLGLRPFLLRSAQKLSVTAMVGFELGGARDALIPETKLFPRLAEAVPGTIDEGLPKPRSEVLLFGTCHAPDGKPVTAIYAGFRLGAIAKRIAVVGDRTWKGSRFTPPQPFSQMPLGWELAFGGPDDKRNPKGRGLPPPKGSEQRTPVALPNLENPSRLIKSPTDRPEPVGFGPIDLSWMPRAARAGSYGPGWLENHFPGFPPDVHPDFFQMAPADQWLDGDAHFRGDEEYAIENMQPANPIVAGKLPGIRARSFVRARGGRDFDEVAMWLDTVVLLPRAGFGVLLFRGVTRVEEDDASDVQCVLLACEALESERTPEHYRTALLGRLDKEQSPMLAMKEDDLLPPFVKSGPGIEEQLRKTADAMRAEAQARRDAAMATLRQELLRAGLDEAQVAAAMASAESSAPQLPELSDAKAVEDFQRSMEVAAEEARQRGEAEAAEMRRLQVEHGIDPDEASGNGRPPAPQAGEIMASLVATRAESIAAGIPVPENLEAMLNDPGLQAKLEQADRAALDGYRDGAPFMAPPAPLKPDAGAERRAAVLDDVLMGLPLDERDLTGCDLSNTSLREMSLRRALMAGVNLTGTDLTRAVLEGALLAHAELGRAVLDDTDCRGANLGAAHFEGTRLDRADLTGASLIRAKVSSASLKGARLENVTMLETELGAVDFEGAVASELDFLKSDLSRCCFRRAKLRKGSFLETQLDGVCFDEADLELVSFVSVSASRASFRGANLRKLHAVMECSLAWADFSGADLEGAFLRGCNLEGADFTGACLVGADLSECNLRGAKLSRAQAKDALFVRSELTGAVGRSANLMQASLKKARLHGVDLSGSNLFGADLGLIEIDDQSRFYGVNRKRALLYPEAKKERP